MAPTDDPKISRCDRCAPSAISIKPIKIKNERPNICNDGCFAIKFPTGFAKSIMIPTEITTAITIIIKASVGLSEIPLVIPTAVRIESKENTRLITAICTIALLNVVELFFEISSSSRPVSSTFS